MSAAELVPGAVVRFADFDGAARTGTVDASAGGVLELYVVRGQHAARVWVRSELVELVRR